MKTKETYQDRYKRAKKRVEEIRGFYSHLMVYILVNIGIVALNYYTTGFEPIFFIYPLICWGIGLMAHGLGTFGTNPFINKEWEKRKIQELMDKDN